MKMICIGDSSVNVFLQVPDKAENVSVEEKERLIRFRLGSKTQLAAEVVTVGGNALNVAVGLARQGVEVEFISIVGEDDDARRIDDFFAQETQKLKLKNQNYSLKLKIERKTEVKTNVGYVINFKGERFILQDTSVKNYQLATINNQPPTTQDWVFLSSIGPDYEEFFAQIVKFKKEKKFKLAYNPSSNEFKKNVETFLPMVETADVLFVNKREAMKIVGEKNEMPSEKLLMRLWGRNQKTVVVTDGVRGSYGYGGKGIFYEPSSGEKAVEKTGAGDAFASGFLVEYLKSGDIFKALKNGTQNAASVVKQVGAVAGLQYKS